MLSTDQLTELAELYPYVDVDLTLRQALAWVRADSRRAKTAKGMKRFCVNWLNGAVARGNFVTRTRPLSSVSPWHCPHVDHCAHRQACEIALLLGPAKYPLKTTGGV